MDDIFDTRFENKKIKLDDNRVNIGDDVNIMAKDPALKDIVVGAGWDINSFDGEAVDVDISLFLLDRKGMTRVDEDFIFYNAPETLAGAIKHNGDSLTGAGDGDDETISIALQGIPFDVFELKFVLTVYKGFERKQNLSMIRNAYIRVLNPETKHEILRFVLDEHIQDAKDSGALIATLAREGPKWHFRPSCQFNENGLSGFARQYGIIISGE